MLIVYVFWAAELGVTESSLMGFPALLLRFKNNTRPPLP
jgi:hypothetical protein